MSWAKRRERLRASRGGRVLLGAASLAYGAGVAGRRLLYDLGFLPRRRLDAKVICLGNLTTGGAGKTPAVLLAAQTLRRAGHSVAILSRGYGRRAPEKHVAILLDGQAADWRFCGDESWILHQALQGLDVPVLVCPDRLKAGELAVKQHGRRVLLLDDGFQHWRLRRDLDVVLVNARDPFGGRRLLPLGDLREPISALRRARLVVITHADRVPAAELESLRREIAAINPTTPIAEAMHKADHVLDGRTGTRHPPSVLAGRSVVALSGIGDPLAFEGLLEELGARVAETWRYPDHHAYTERELRSAEALGNGLPIVTTWKDYARLPERWRAILRGDVLVLGITLEFLKGRELWTEALERAAA
ncbi:MAG: tetraacyldisaccharide 4'-kinase [Elusimicrobia bacterium]|nr:tetraacyldisaccharide 4'-kinase [Elusimicrobiota bacterium]